MPKIRGSWEKVRAIDPHWEKQGVLLFYNIFHLAPEALQMFSFKDQDNLYESPVLKAHGSGVMRAMDKAVQGDSKDLNDLGKRHVNRGVAIAHYDIVGQSVLKTLEQALGDEMWEDVGPIWIRFFGVLAQEMQRDNY